MTSYIKSVGIILKNEVQFVTFPFFYMVELQNFLNAPRVSIVPKHCVSKFTAASRGLRCYCTPLVSFCLVFVNRTSTFSLARASISFSLTGKTPIAVQSGC